MRGWLVIAIFGCSTPAKREPAANPPPTSASAPQTVAEGIAILCASDWNGELHGSPIRPWIPDSLHHTVTNEDVRRLITVLASPDVKRPELFDRYLAETHTTPGPCPFRERLPSWPRELPILPAKP